MSAEGSADIGALSLAAHRTTANCRKLGMSPMAMPCSHKPKLSKIITTCFRANGSHLFTTPTILLWFALPRQTTGCTVKSLQCQNRRRPLEEKAPHNPNRRWTWTKVGNSEFTKSSFRRQMPQPNVFGSGEKPQFGDASCFSTTVYDVEPARYCVDDRTLSKICRWESWAVVYAATRTRG